MSSKRTRIIAGAAVLGFMAATAPAALADGDAPRGGQSSDGRHDGENLAAIGLTPDGKRLVSFDTDRPERARDLGVVQGLVGDGRLVGIDHRPANGLLYGVGDKGGVYTIAGATATKVSQLSVALSGTAFDIDFNPVVDRLRIVSDAGQNLRHDVGAQGGTSTDGVLSYPAAPPATTPTTATGVTGAAYTNNDADPATATTLFDVDTVLDQVVIQSPANAGLLAATGKLGVDATGDAGFDIYSEVRRGSAVELFPYLVLQVGGRYGLYEVSLLTGRVTPEGTFPRDRQVSDIALVPGQL
ncbi:DUF4394 domain-containing protein [Modestobacter versicolor]|uniref:DUF4394 domain-containing protein n=1 Tax=Modestobacter versicolor TaxID=429133 RepID=A0A323V7J9_9ACTN|nr:DUF4394 domain-containing protein [Modestobacter versicolor]MBB3677313.1 hypothetical protein [Modestobacter versicolor]PZA20857.1 hypothetical protein DMO24_13300 [Modestobacter versicolor]